MCCCSAHPGQQVKGGKCREDREASVAPPARACSSYTEKEPLHSEHAGVWREGNAGVLITEKASEDEHFKAIRGRQKNNLGDGAMTQSTLGENDSENIETGVQTNGQGTHVHTCEHSPYSHACTHSQDTG